MHGQHFATTHGSSHARQQHLHLRNCWRLAVIHRQMEILEPMASQRILRQVLVRQGDQHGDTAALQGLEVFIHVLLRARRGRARQPTCHQPVEALGPQSSCNGCSVCLQRLNFHRHRRLGQSFMHTSHWCVRCLLLRQWSCLLERRSHLNERGIHCLVFIFWKST